MLVFLVTNDYHSSMSNNNKVSQGGSNTMYKNLKSKNQGFTIIEVLIVLAIAGLIMLIVFLAVPALQRNSRNNARTQSATKVAAAMTDCLSNRNYVFTSCASAAALNNPVGTGDALSTVSFGGAAYSQTDARIVNSGSVVCHTDGSAPTAGGGPRSFVVTFQLEGAGGGAGLNRCIGA